MTEYIDSERTRLRRIEKIEDALRSDVRGQRKTILSRIRTAGARSIVSGLILTLSLFSNYNKAYADTDKIKKEISIFNNWLGDNINKLKDGTISWDEATRRFEDAFINLEKEVRHDLEEHKYEKALYNLQFFYKLAESLHNDAMQQKIYYLIKDIETELATKRDREGIFNVNDNIYVVGTVRTQDYNTARRRATGDATAKLTQVMTQLTGTNKSISIQGTNLVKIYYLEGQSSYRYVVSIAIVNDIATTRALLQKLPRASE